MVYRIDGMRSNAEGHKPANIGTFLRKIVTIIRENPLPTFVILAVFCALALLYRNYVTTTKTEKPQQKIETKLQAGIAVCGSEGYMAGIDELGDWKHADGTPLITKSSELCLKFRTYNKTEEFKHEIAEFQFWLPSSLFEGKKDGDTLELMYKDKVVKFTIDQKQIQNERKEPFESIFDGVRNDWINRLEGGYLGYDGSNKPVFDSTIEKVSDLYTLDTGNSSQKIETKYQASIGVEGGGGCMAGNDELGDWKHFDGSPLITKPKELCLKFRLFNGTKEFKYETNEFQFLFLPSFLFEGKKEGNTLELMYKDKVVKLKIDQKQIQNERKEPFESIFDGVRNDWINRLDEGLLGFEGSSKPVSNSIIDKGSDRYTLDHGGVLYQVSCDQGIGKPNQVTNANKLRAWDTIEKPRPEVLRSENCIRICFDLPLGKNNRVDIVINEKFLSFAAEGLSLDPNQKITRGHILSMSWRQLFPNVTQQDMQSKIEKASISYKSGIFYISLPA